MSILELSPQLRPEDLLRQRGISDETIAAFRIRPTQDGWAYPVPGSPDILRWKAFDSNTKSKYRWLPTKPPQVLYYHAPDLWQAVRDMDGSLWIVSGEPDVWAMHSAGIHNTLSFYGEMSIPATLVADVKKLGVLRIYTAPDLDSTGLGFAQKLKSLLTGSEIKLTVYKLPEHLGTGGDIGKIWQWHRDPLTFQSWLHHLPTLEVLELAVIPPTPKLNKPDLAQSANNQVSPEQSDDIYDQVAKTLGVTKYYQNGFSHLVRCPFHEDAHASAGWHKQKHILHCFRCGKDFLAKEVAAKLRIEWPKSSRSTTGDEPVKHRATAPQKPVEHISTSSALSTQTLPTEARETLIQRKLTNLARILDTLYQASWTDGREFDIYDALDRCKEFNIAYRTLYETLQIGITTTSGIFVSVFCPAFFMTQSREKNGNKIPQRGRPRRRYRLPSVSEICEWLGINMMAAHEDVLLPDAFSSASLYRASVYGAFPSREPGTYKREVLADRIGISEPTACRYDKLFGLEVTARYRRNRLDNKSIPAYSTNRQDRPGWEWIEGSKGWPYPPTREGLLRALQSGEAWRVIQLSNHYGPPPAIPPVEPITVQPWIAIPMQL